MHGDSVVTLLIADFTTFLISPNEKCLVFIRNNRQDKFPLNYKLRGYYKTL